MKVAISVLLPLLLNCIRNLRLCQQQKGRLVDFGHKRDIMDRIKISDGERRDSGEGADGWKTVELQ